MPLIIVMKPQVREHGSIETLELEVIGCKLRVSMEKGVRKIGSLHGICIKEVEFEKEGGGFGRLL